MLSSSFYFLSRPLPFLLIQHHHQQTKEGFVYEGVLESVSAAAPAAANGDAKSSATAPSLVARLRIVSKLSAPDGRALPSANAERPLDSLDLAAGDLVSLDARDVRLGAEGVVAVGAGGAFGELGTDAEIGAGKGG